MKKQQTICIITATVLLILIGASGFAQGWNIEMTDMRYEDWNDVTEICLIDDSHVLVAVENLGVSIVDISDTENPYEISLYEEDETLMSMEVSGDYAYLSIWTVGIVILDISDLYNPVNTNILIDQHAPSLCAVGEYLYLVNNYEEFKIIDISDPLDPQILGGCHLPYDPCALAVEGDYAYISKDYGGLMIVDVSVAADPYVLSNIDFIGNSYGLAVQDDYVYVANGGCGFVVVDISDPAAPFQACNIPISNVAGVIVTGDIGYLQAGYPHLQTIDISDPTRPVVIGECIPLGNMRDMILVGEEIISAYDYYGMKVFDVSDPVDPSVVSSYKASWSIHSVEYYGGYAFVTVGNGILHIMDVSDPFNMRLAKVIQDTIGFYHITIHGNYAYFKSDDESLLIMDISNPLEPIAVSTYASDGSIREFDDENQLAYLSDGWPGLEIVDISDITNPVQISAYSTGYRYIGDLTVNGNYLYAIASEYSDYCGDSLLVVNIEDISNPLFAGYFYAPNYSSQLEIYNGMLLLSANSGLYYYDITDPANPEYSSHFEMEYGPKKFEIQWEYMYYLSGSAGGIRTMDITDIMNPVETGYYITPDYPSEFARNGNNIYVADWDHFEIYDCDNAVGIEPEGYGNIPSEYRILNPYPNPFNPTTTISFELPVSGNISLKIYDITGREVAALGTGHWALGEHSVVWNAEGLSSGVYFVRLTAGDFRQTQKLLLIK